MDMSVIVVAAMILVVVIILAKIAVVVPQQSQYVCREAWKVRWNARCRVSHSGPVSRFHPLPPLV